MLDTKKNISLGEVSTAELYTHISKEYVNLLKVHQHGLIKNRPMAFHYDAHVSGMVC